MREAFEVILLTQDQCKLCDEAKDILDRVARDFPLAVESVHLGSQRGQKLALQGGVMFPPGVLVDGEPFSYGRLSERKLRKELSRRVAA